MEITSRSQRWSRKTFQPINANGRGLNRLVLMSSIQVTFIPLLHIALYLHFLPRLAICQINLGVWTPPSRVQILPKPSCLWKCQSISTWCMYMKFWSSIRSVLRGQMSHYWTSHLLNCIIKFLWNFSLLSAEMLFIYHVNITHYCFYWMNTRLCVPIMFLVWFDCDQVSHELHSRSLSISL